MCLLATWETRTCFRKQYSLAHGPKNNTYIFKRSFGRFQNDVEESDMMLSRLDCSKGRVLTVMVRMNYALGKKVPKLTIVTSNFPEVVLLNPLSNSSSTHKSNNCQGFGATGTYTQGRQIYSLLQKNYFQKQSERLVTALVSCKAMGRLRRVNREQTGDVL